VAKKIISGNEAIALGALSAGVKVITGYPGTPSSEVIGSLWKKNDLEGTHVEWSVNEKVAVEIAAAASWAGYRSLCTMKMSGLNVAYDSLIGFAYSGCHGGLVIYVADDPGVTTGMCEQDTRGFAIMSDLPILEPGTVQECYDFTKMAFELSEATGTPVFVRGVTNVSQSHAKAEIGERKAPPEQELILEKDISKYTKAGAVLCMTQHRNLIARLEKAAEWLTAKGLNHLALGKAGGLGIISVGVTNCYVPEALELARQNGCNLPEENLTLLKLAYSVPFPVVEMKAVLANCSTVLVVEELEPYLEKELYRLAYEMGVKANILGKSNGIFSRIGEYNAGVIVKGLFAACGKELPEVLAQATAEAEKLCTARPIGVCAGCPHRGTFLSINQAIKNKKLKKNQVMVTGDIGCTILGMNPPFHTLWTEVSMGASIPVATGYYYAGIKTPVIATIGDSTFFHAGIPGLINAIQQNVDLTVVILDNGWTAMTGMQVNPGTAKDFQKSGSNRIDIVQVVRGLGVENLYAVDPYDLQETTKAVEEAMGLPGVKVIVCRRECAIEAGRRKVSYGKIKVVEENCNQCKLCITTTGCTAITLGETSIEIDPLQCNGCGICAQVCNRGAIEREG